MDQSEHRRLRILSLDGGGVRGLSSIMILQRIMNSFNRKRGDGRKLQPWQIFDLIGGTSTGGIIAIMLGRLRMSIEDCEAAYLKLSERIFQPRHSKFSFQRTTTFLQADGKFDATVLEKAIKETLAENGYPQDLLLEDLDDSCRCFVVATRASNSEPAILRSFENTESDNLLFGECKVWEACRATSAAPTFFDSITIGRRKQKFADGGMIYNNPVEQVHQEAETLWPGQEKLLISIGTGDAPGASFNGNIQTLVNAMKAIVTNTQIKADDFHKSHHSLVEAKLYFRFSVAQGLENVGLEEYDAVDKIADATDVYIARPEPRQKFEDCVQSLLEEKSKAQKASEHLFQKDCLEYLSDSSHSHHSCYSPKEFDEESCAWILTHSKYRQWVFPNSSNLFWLTGGSGIGKTTLSSFIGKQLNKELANGSEPQAVVLSYFCDENTDILDLLRHLIWHYLQLRPDLFGIIAGKFDPKTRRLYDKENRIHGLFDSIQQLGSQGPSYVIIDGLDECVDKIEVQMLVEKIAQLGYYSESSTASFKVLLSFSDEISLSITSQSIPKMQRIDMYEEMKLADFKNLRCYAEKQIRNLAWVPSSKVDKIAEDLVTRAEGSFIWLYLTCSNMRERAPGFDPTQTSLLPEGMSSMIKKMILRIDLQDRSQAARVLRCLSAARRPLIINEIGDVLGLDSSETRRYVKCCGYLLSTYEGEKVKLCHNAIRQYLESKEVKDDQFIAEFGLGKIQEEISEVCFELLSREFRSHSDAAEKRPTANVSARPLSEYATKYWPNHARLAELPPSFFEHHNGELFKAMWRSNWERTGLAHRKIPRNFNLFHVGAVFGLVGLIRYYTDIISWNSLKLRKQLRKKDSTGHTPLSWAAEFGHEDIVQYLLFQEKLDPNGLQGPFGSALQTATSWGQVHIVELLLKGEPKIRASNIDEKKGKFGTALQAAAITGNSKIARILIKYGADPNVQKSGWFSNALQAAAANGSTEVVQLLLKAKNNADPNSQGGWYGNALRAASTKGYAKIVKMLLSHGATVDHNEKLQDIISCFMSLRTILPPNTRLKASMHLAQRHSLISVVKSEAASIRSKMAKRYTKTVSTQEAFLFALHHVLYRSNLVSTEKGGSFGALTDEELQHLTDQGFEMYLRGLFYGNALQAAAAEGHTQVVDILMANHADVNANVGIFGTALQAAVAENKPDVVDLLLTRDDVDLYQRGGAYGSAMSAALREGYKDIEQKLRVAGLRRQGNAGRGNIETL